MVKNEHLWREIVTFNTENLHVMTFSIHEDQSKHCLMAQRVVSRGFLWLVCVEKRRQVFALKSESGLKSTHQTSPR